MNDNLKKPIEPSMIARAVNGAINSMKNWSAAWFGPGQAMSVMVDDPRTAGVQGRQYDYPVGINRIITPRSNDAVSFAQLRALADNCDILRIVIETRKDEMAKLKWSIKPRDTLKKPDDRCKKLEDFFQFPDQEHDWDTWLRMLLEELFVTDAPALYVRRTLGKGIYSFDPLDGATIKRVIDEFGRTPTAPEPAYQQVLKGVVAANYSTDELIYRPRNQRVWKAYGYSPVEQIVMTVNTAIRRSVSVLQYYSEGNIPEAVAGMPDTWTSKQIQEFQDYWDSLMEGNQAQKRRVKFIPGKVDLQFTKDAVLKDEFDEWLARVVCFTFSLEPTAFVKQMNRATAQTAREAAQEAGMAPTMQWVVNLMNYMLMIMGSPDLQFSWNDEKAIDPKVQAEIDEIDIRNGVIMPDERRTARLGLEPLTDEQLARQAASRQLAPLPINPTMMPNEAPEPGAQSVDAGGDQVAGQDKGTKTTDADKQPPDPMAKGDIAKAKKPKPGPIDPDRDEMKKQEKKTAKVVRNFFKDQAGKVVDSAKPGKAILSVNWDELTRDITPVLTETATLGAVAALDSISVNADTVTYGARVEKWAADRAAEMVGKKWVDGKLVDNPNAEWVISDSTRDMVNSAVTQAVDQGWTTDELAAKLEEAFGPQRAEMIARTETRLADANAQMIAYEESGVVDGTEWTTSNDDLVSEECQANAAAGVVPLGEEYPSGDIAPPAHPACRCSCVPVLK